MGGQKLILGPQTLVFTAGGRRLTGGVLHFGNLCLQDGVLRFQSLIFEHVAVVAFYGVGQTGGHGPEGGQRALDQQVRDALVGQAGQNGKTRRHQHGDDQNDAELGIE